jgi:hypothetical protein
MSEKQVSCDAFSLLYPRARNPDTLPELASRSMELVDLVRPEREPERPWLEPKGLKSKLGAESSIQSLENHH